MITVRLPPSIVVHPLKYKVYNYEDEVTLECIATGVPTPQLIFLLFQLDWFTYCEFQKVFRVKMVNISKFLSSFASDIMFYSCLSFSPLYHVILLCITVDIIGGRGWCSEHVQLCMCLKVWVVQERLSTGPQTKYSTTEQWFHSPIIVVHSGWGPLSVLCLQ